MVEIGLWIIVTIIIGLLLFVKIREEKPKDRERNRGLLCAVGILLVFYVMISTNFITTLVSADNKVAVTLENCEPFSWVGVVQYLDNKTDYKDLPEAELKRTGKLTIMLEPGEYGITYYSPSYKVKMKNGKTLMVPSKILDFREVVVKRAVTLSFGCEGIVDGAV